MLHITSRPFVSNGAIKTKRLSLTPIPPGEKIAAKPPNTESAYAPAMGKKGGGEDSTMDPVQYQVPKEKKNQLTHVNNNIFTADKRVISATFVSWPNRVATLMIKRIIVFGMETRKNKNNADTMRVANRREDREKEKTDREPKAAPIGMRNKCSMTIAKNTTFFGTCRAASLCMRNNTTPTFPGIYLPNDDMKMLFTP
jgi:hypothetical protein